MLLRRPCVDRRAEPSGGAVRCRSAELSGDRSSAGLRAVPLRRSRVSKRRAVRLCRMLCACRSARRAVPLRCPLMVIAFRRISAKLENYHKVVTLLHGVFSRVYSGFFVRRISAKCGMKLDFNYLLFYYSRRF